MCLAFVYFITLCYNIFVVCICIIPRFLRHVGASPYLRSDPVFIDFLEIENDLIKSSNTSALSGAGVMRLFYKVGKEFTKITYNMEETDEVGAELLQS